MCTSGGGKCREGGWAVAQLLLQDFCYRQCDSVASCLVRRWLPEGTRSRAAWDTLDVLVERGHRFGLRSKGCNNPQLVNARGRLPPESCCFPEGTGSRAPWVTLVVLVERGHLYGLRSKGCNNTLFVNARGRLNPYPRCVPLGTSEEVAECRRGPAALLPGIP